MKTAVVSLTKNGAVTASRIGHGLKADVYVRKEFMGSCAGQYTSAKIYPVGDRLSDLIARIFRCYDAFVFVTACGIVVRAIAPYIKDKRTDPAVVVVDEKGEYAVSLLSGHFGGANSLAREIALITGGRPVITTATDVNGVTAFDSFADENDCAVENLANLKYISAELVNGGKVCFYTDFELSGAMPENLIKYGSEGNVDYKYAVVLSNRNDIDIKAEKTVFIRPRNLILGIGCRRGTSKEQIRIAVKDFLQLNGKALASIKCMATIDLKKDENGLTGFCDEHGLDLCLVSREDVKKVESNFAASDFVQDKLGIGSVAEPCAIICGNNARLICSKTVYRGITLALAEEGKIFRI